MSPIRIFIAAALMFATGVACAEVRITPQDSGVKVRLRGISAVSADIAWASGREGTVLRTIDGGKHWQTIKVPDAGELDFRDVEGFDADAAVVLSIGPGEASRVYRTEDSGKSWKLTLQNKDPRAFFDCMAFDGEHGWMLGDPVDGRFQVYSTSDAGRTWQLLADGPKAMQGEAAFAASGTCIAKVPKAVVVGTGGKVSRIHYLHDQGKKWSVISSRISEGTESAGVFSISSFEPNAILAVGGDYRKERVSSETKKFSFAVADNFTKQKDSGKTADVEFALLDFGQRFAEVRGYRSGAACAAIDSSNRTCIAVGPSGADALKRKTWEPVSEIGYDAIDLAGHIGWASGDAGRIARIEITD